MQPLKSNLKILIVDDKPNMLKTMTGMLRHLGYQQVTKADDGDTALEILRGEERFHLVISDWKMQRVSGYELLKTIREDDQLKALPFLMVTGETDPSIVAQAGEIEVDGYLLKPFSQEDLGTKIQEIFKRKRNPSKIDMHIAVARVFMESRNYDQALDELKKALKVDARSPRVSYALGQLYEARGDLANARQLYERSVSFSKQFLKGYESLARVQESQGDSQNAAENLKRAAEISPSNVDRQMRLGRSLLKAGRLTELETVLNGVLKMVDRNTAEIAREVGETLLQAGLAGAAQKAFQKAITASPDDLYSYNRMGIALRKQKKFKEAILNYQKALALDPKNENLYYNLGRAFFEAGDNKRAGEALSKAIEISPQFGAARLLLSKIRRPQGQGEVRKDR